MGIVRRASMVPPAANRSSTQGRARSSIRARSCRQTSRFGRRANVDRMLEQAVDRRHDVGRPAWSMQQHRARRPRCAGQHARMAQQVERAFPADANSGVAERRAAAKFGRNHDHSVPFARRRQRRTGRRCGHDRGPAPRRHVPPQASAPETRAHPFRKRSRKACRPTACHPSADRLRNSRRAPGGVR